MANLAAGSSAGESASLTLDKRHSLKSVCLHNHIRDPLPLYVNALPPLVVLISDNFVIT